MRYIRLLLLSFILLCSCSRNPVTGKQELHFVSQSQEILIGSEQYLLMQQADGGPYLSDPELLSYVQKVGHKLASASDRKKLPYEFVILDNPIPNAWALPGGKIAINSGLLLELKSEAELAAVLSHEIVHSAARHGAQGLQRSILMQVGLLGMQEILKNYPYQPLITGTGALGASLLQMKYSREAELEADAYGIKYMAGAGYDPQAAIALQKMFLRLSQNQKSHWLIGLFASHPPSEERIEANEKTARLYTKDAVLMDGQKEYAEAIASLQKTKPAGECLLKGTHALLAQNPQEALSWAQEGLRINPQGAHLHNLAGKAKLALNDFKGAFASFQKACDLNPSYFDFYLGLGLAEYNLNFHKAAREHLEKSLLFFPTAEAHITLGNIHLQNHDTPQALTHFQEASLADSPLGQKAKASFTRLDLITHPEHYITLTPSWNPHGNLSLHLKNSSQLPVHDIFLELAFKDVKGLTTTKPLRIPAVVPPGEDKTLTTSLSHDPALSLPTIKIINLEIYQYE